MLTVQTFQIRTLIEQQNCQMVVSMLLRVGIKAEIVAKYLFNTLLQLFELETKYNVHAFDSEKIGHNCRNLLLRSNKGQKQTNVDV